MEARVERVKGKWWCGTALRLERSAATHPPLVPSSSRGVCAELEPECSA